MWSTTIASSWQSSCYNYALPKLTLNSTPRQISQCLNYTSIITLAANNSFSKEKEKKPNHYPDDTLFQNLESRQFFQDFYASIEPQKPEFEVAKEKQGFLIGSYSDVSSAMWWSDLKAALGQRINLEGVAFAIRVFSRDRNLVIPHVTVPDIRYIDWAELKKRGFKGVVFDKDNTITVPYSLSLWPPLGSSIQQCKSLFGDHIAVFSNSAGLFEYDPDGRKAKALEDAIGIKVIRHKVKKPAGSAGEIESHFGCESSRLILVGDRPFTDIVYGNRNGFFTILTEPLSLAEEPLIVKQVRLLEVALVKQWSKKGLKPTSHSLIPDSAKCVKDVPLC